MIDAERRTALLEVQMLELFADALGEIRPVIVRRLQASCGGADRRDQTKLALSEIALEAARKFEHTVAPQSEAVSYSTTRIPAANERELAS